MVSIDWPRSACVHLAQCGGIDPLTSSRFKTASLLQALAQFSEQIGAIDVHHLVIKAESMLGQGVFFKIPSKIRSLSSKAPPWTEISRPKISGAMQKCSIAPKIRLRICLAGMSQRI